MDNSILERIKNLVSLQRIDAQIYEFKRQFKEKPVVVEDLRERFEGKKINLKKLEDQLKASLLARKDKELDLKTKEEALTKFNTQLTQMKTNKEYTAKLSEIESIKADQSLIEEKILISYDETDQLSNLIQKEKNFLAEEEKNFLVQKNEIEISLKEIQEKFQILESQRKQITPGVNKTILERYERILQNKEGLAIVPVYESSCGGCYMNVPHQVFNEIKMHDKIIYCEMCARILYLEEAIKN